MSSVDSAIEILESIPGTVDYAETVGAAIDALKAAVAAGQVVSPPWDDQGVTVRAAVCCLRAEA